MTDTVDQRVTQAREYLTAARGRDVNYLRPAALLEEVVELRRHLGQVLAAAAGQEDEARQLAGIRAVLAAFDWETDDRQYALEAIERIADGDGQ